MAALGVYNAELVRGDATTKRLLMERTELRLPGSGTFDLSVGPFSLSKV